MRHRPLMMLAALLAVLTFGAVPARADWLPLVGLNGAGWTREVVTGTPPTTMYAATEYNGVWRSLNNGVTWQAFNGGLTGVPGAMSVRTVFTSGTTVYAGTSAGLFKSDGGGSFQPVAQGPEDDPKNPKKLNQAVQAVFTGVVPGQMLAGVASGGVYKSSDGGNTWQPPAPNNGMARSESVWSLGSYKDGLIYAATGSGIYVSLNFGSTWTLASDGITGTTLRTFADDKYPNIYYATGTDGVFRSINAGLTWTNITPNVQGAPNPGQVRAMTQFSGIEEKRFYIGTEHGVFAGRTGLSPLPGPVKWRKVTDGGLNNDTIVWGLTSFINTPGTLIAGTQDKGGYALTFIPPSNNGTKPVLSNLSPKEGETLTTTNGGWNGTPTIEFEYQWQDCTGSCTDIEGANEPSFVVPTQGRKYRVSVIAKNDFPTGSFVHAESLTTNAAGAKPGTLPGDNQSSTGKIVVLNDADGFPQPGETLHAQDWLFNPAATSTSFTWFRCDTNGLNCAAIPGQTAQNYVLTDEDVTNRLCVAVTGKNASGSNTLGCTAVTNEIFPKAPKATKPTTLMGNAYVGDTLVSGVGAWEVPTTRFDRVWEACNPDGSSCSAVDGPVKTSTYVVRPGDLGKRLRVAITVDSNKANKKPDEITVYTPLSDVVTNPPVPQDQPNGGGGGGQQGGGGQPGGGGQNPPPPVDKTKPALSKLSIKSGKLTLTVSEAAKLKIVVKKGKKTVSTVTVNVAAGKRTVKVSKKKLKKGSYKATITATDAAGNTGAAKAVSFKIKK